MTKKLKFANYHAKQLYNIQKILNNVSHNINKKNKPYINILPIGEDVLLENLKEKLQCISSSKNKNDISIYLYMPNNSIALQQNNQTKQETLYVSDIISHLNRNIKKYTEKLQQLNQITDKKIIKSIKFKTQETVALKKIMNIVNNGLISDLINENTIIQKTQNKKEIIIMATPNDAIALQEILEINDIDYNKITIKDLENKQNKPKSQLDNTSQKSLNETEMISMCSYHS